MQVHLKTKNKGIKHRRYHCCQCSDPIIAGQKYYQWKFRGQEPTRQHQTHGAPRQSQLMLGRLSEVYAAIEGLEDDLAAARKSEDISELASAFETAAEEVERVRDEYQEGLDAMPDSLQSSSKGEESQEKIDALDTFADSISTAADDLGSVDEDEDNWLENAIDAAESALSEFSL